MSLEVTFSYFLEELEKDGINSWLVEFAMKLSGLRVLSVERVLIVDSISGLFSFSVFSWFSLGCLHVFRYLFIYSRQELITPSLRSGLLKLLKLAIETIQFEVSKQANLLR